MPIDFSLSVVSVSVPSSQLVLECVKIGDASIETLACEGGEFDFSHVEPRAMFWRVMDFETIEQTSCRVGLKSFVESGGFMRIEIITHQHDFFGSGVLHVEQIRLAAVPTRSWCGVHGRKRYAFRPLARRT